MEKGFLEALKIKRNTTIGAIIGILLGGFFFYTKYEIRQQLEHPLILDLGLAIVLAIVTALFVTILITLSRWLAWGIKAESLEKETGKENRPQSSEDDS